MSITLDQEQLKQISAKVEPILGNHPAMALVIDKKDGRICYANQVCCKFYGYSFEDFTQLFVFDINTYPKEITLKYLQKTIDAKQNRLKFEHRKSDGTLVEVNIETGIIEIDGQEYILSFIQDLTDNIQLLRKATQSESRLKNVIEATQSATWEWNVQTGETIFDENWANILGYKLDEISPVSIKTWEKYAHPEDLKASKKLLEDHFEGKTSYYEFASRMRHKDGHWIWVLDRGKVISHDLKGKPLLMYGTHMDITAQQQTQQSLINSEKLFKTVTTSSPLGITLYDKKGFLCYANQSALDLLGVKNFQALRSYNLLEDQNLSLKHKEKILNGEKVNFIQAVSLNEYLSASQHHNLIRSETSLSVIITPLPDSSEYGFMTHFSDVTELVTKENELKMMLDRFQVIANVTNDLLFSWDIQSGVIHWFEDCSTIFGDFFPCTIEKLLSVVHEDDIPVIDAAAKEGIINKKPWHTKYRILLNNKTIHMKGSAAAIYKDDVPVIAYGAITNITEEIEIKSHLAESVEKFRTIATQTNDIIYEMDMSNLSINWYGNPAKVFNNQIPPNLNEFSVIIVPEDLDKVNNLFQEGIANEESWQSNYRININGQIKYISGTGVAIYKENIPVKVYGTITDVTNSELANRLIAKNELQLRTILHNIDELIILLNEDTCAFINTENTLIKQDLTNLGFFEEGKQHYSRKFITRQLLSIVHPDDIEMVNNAYRQHFQTLEPLDIQFRIEIGKKLLWLWSRSYAVDNDDFNLLGIIKDITRSKEHETELLRINNELDSFVYRVSHDLRAPISSSLGLSQLIENTEDIQEILTYTGLQKKSLLKLDQFIHNILDYSRNSRMEVNASKINFRNIIETIETEHNFKSKHDQVTITYNISDYYDFYSDVLRIKVIIQNLISNALKYQKPYEDNKRVSVQIEANEHYANLIIEDNGIGIPEDFVEPGIVIRD